ncbi:MAG: hypothetical protein J0G33_12615 [Afipia felis]|nr:hypothetical protein [Afipia felis]
MARKFDKLPPATLKALVALKSAGIRCPLMTEYHIKARKYNFWPAHGKIYIDNEGPHHASGVDAFIALVKADPETAVFCQPATDNTATSQTPKGIDLST